MNTKDYLSECCLIKEERIFQTFILLKTCNLQYFNYRLPQNWFLQDATTIS